MMLGLTRLTEHLGRSLEAVERVEAWLLRRALEANQHQRVRTARQLGITREGLYKKRPTSTGIARVLQDRRLAGLCF